MGREGQAASVKRTARPVALAGLWALSGDVCCVLSTQALCRRRTGHGRDFGLAAEEAWQKEAEEDVRWGTAAESEPSADEAGRDGGVRVRRG